jgi:hypothetical protein
LNFASGRPLTRVYIGKAWVSVPARSAGDRDPLGFRSAMQRAFSGQVDNPNGGEAKDLYALSWRVGQQQLWRVGWGRSVPQFESHHVHPFIGARDVESVITDTKGNLFIRTRAPFWDPNYVVLAVKGATPETRLELVPLGLDSLQVRLNAVKAPAAFFIWRHNGGPWQEAAPGTHPSLAGLSSGTHVIEAVALDDALQAGSAPAAQTFTVAVKPEIQIQALICELSAPEHHRREAGIQQLAQRAKEAGPILRQAREGASAELRWWIDAALQAIEDRERVSK